jgi:hypothetical protein
LSSLEEDEEVEIAFDPPRHEDRVIHRWLAFLFFAMMGLVAIACLTRAALAV